MNLVEIKEEKMMIYDKDEKVDKELDLLDFNNECIRVC